MAGNEPSRRDLLTGRALRDRAAAAQDALAAAALEVAGPNSQVPRAGGTVRLTVRAMATEFGVLLNPGSVGHSRVATEALDVVSRIEQQLTVYRDDSEVSRLNATAGTGPQPVAENLFELLRTCDGLHRQTAGAFDVATHSQITLWRRCKEAGRLPSDAEIATALIESGMSKVRLDPESQTVAVERAGVCFNFGAIGKGYALDCCASLLTRAATPPGEDPPSAVPQSPESFQEAGAHQAPASSNQLLTDDDRAAMAFCLYGGHSSILASGDHNKTGGWPVGIGNPLFTSRRLGTVLLKDRALGTSGSNIQFFRHDGKRYGHILDPRTARPAGELLSVSVFAPTAAIADALSTAFFVLGVEKACAICDNQPLIGALLIPPPRRGGRLDLIAVGIPDDILFLDTDQVTVARPG